MSRVDEQDLTATVIGLASIPSSSGDERRIAEWLCERLSAAGVDTELQDVHAGRPNVIATVELPEPGPTLLFNGHLDTLPVDESLPRPYDARLEDGWLYGAGVNNMKAAVGAFLSALLAVRDAGVGRGRIVLTAVMGECDALGLGTIHALEHGLRADACINGEPTELRILTDHAGVSQLNVVVRGREVHVYERELGANAVEAAARVVAALNSAELSCSDGGLERLPLVNAGTIAGGTWPSLTAAECTIGVDVRSTGKMTPDSIRDDVARIARAAIGEGFELDVTLREPPGFVQQRPYHVDADVPIVRAVAAALEAEIGRSAELGPHWPESCFGTDASHIAAAGIPTVICGPGSHAQISRPNERVSLAELLSAARVYERAALTFLGATA